MGKASASADSMSGLVSVSIVWYLFAFVLLSFPTTLPVTAASMNCERKHVNS